MSLVHFSPATLGNGPGNHLGGPRGGVPLGGQVSYPSITPNTSMRCEQSIFQKGTGKREKGGNNQMNNQMPPAPEAFSRPLFAPSAAMPLKKGGQAPAAPPSAVADAATIDAAAAAAMPPLPPRAGRGALGGGARHSLESVAIDGEVRTPFHFPTRVQEVRQCAGTASSTTQPSIAPIDNVDGRSYNRWPCRR